MDNAKTKSSSWRKCAAANCNREGTRLLSFPKTTLGKRNNETVEEKLARCKQWFKNCGNSDLLLKSAHDLNGKFFICSAHFENGQFASQKTERLLPTAIPTVFSQASTSGNPNNSSYSDRSIVATQNSETFNDGGNNQLGNSVDRNIHVNSYTVDNVY